jgi:hypothetical protein
MWRQPPRLSKPEAALSEAEAPKASAAFPEATATPRLPSLPAVTSVISTTYLFGRTLIEIPLTHRF